MAGMLWSVDTRGGFMWSPNLSKYLRTKMQPRQRFRNFCDAVDGSEKKLHNGATFYWNIYSDVAVQGWRLAENRPIPETNGTIVQGSLTVHEAGNSVPHTELLEDLAEHQIEDMIEKMLVDDCAKYHDIEAFYQFDETPIRFAPAGGTSPTSITVTTNGSTATTNNIALGLGHVKAISDEMRERNVPGFIDDDYVAISHPTTYRPFRNELEDLHQYTPAGWNMILKGEIGRYEGMRFFTQTNIPKGGAIDSTTFNPITRVADEWNNGKSSWAFFFGRDTVAEGVLIPEEIRGKLPGDFGRDRGMGWYYLGGYGIIHSVAANARIFKWDSAA